VVGIVALTLVQRRVHVDLSALPARDAAAR
jgi:hypothetical protein